MPNADSYRNGAWQTAFPREAMFVLAPENEETTWAEEWRMYGHLSMEATLTLSAALTNSTNADDTGPAHSWEALSVPNGDYEVQVTDLANGGYQQDTFYFRIHKVSDGSLQGKRIIKHRPADESIYRGFAFVTRSAGFSLWRRFERDAEEMYVQAARVLVEKLRITNPEHRNDDTSGIEWSGRALTQIIGNHRFDIVVRHRCAICNCELHGHPHQQSPIAWCEDHIPRIDAEERPDSAPQPASRARRSARSLPMCEVTGTEVQ